MRISTTSPDDAPRPSGLVRERIQLLDSIRALAIIGVVFIHVTGMVMSYRAGAVLSGASRLDMAFAFFDLGFIIDKARACFAFLFGVSFAILIGRAEQRGGASAFYLRRMAGLLVLGLINQTFLFFGDILATYAVVGLTLMPLRRLSDRAMLVTAVTLILLPTIAETVASAGGWTLPALVHGAAGGPWDANAAAAYDGSRYADVVRQNLLYPVQRWLFDTGSTVLATVGVLGLFLLGFWSARRGILFNVAAHRPLLKRLAWTALPVGFALSLASLAGDLGFNLSGGMAVMAKAATIGGPIMGVGYIALFALLFTNSVGPVQRLLAPLGRMSLTAYLGNALVAGPLLYGYGLGLGATITLTGLNLLAAAIIVGLLAFAHLWLRRFRFGPLEWLWRSFTYGSLQPLRRPDLARI